MREGTYPIVLDIDKTRSIATESSFESSELSTPCSIASQSTTEFSMQYSSYPENETGKYTVGDPRYSTALTDSILSSLLMSRRY